MKNKYKKMLQCVGGLIVPIGVGAELLLEVAVFPDSDIVLRQPYQGFPLFFVDHTSEGEPHYMLDEKLQHYQIDLDAYDLTFSNVGDMLLFDREQKRLYRLGPDGQPTGNALGGTNFPDGHTPQFAYRLEGGWLIRGDAGGLWRCYDNSQQYELLAMTDGPFSWAAFADTESVYFEQRIESGSFYIKVAEGGTGDATQLFVPSDRVQWFDEDDTAYYTYNNYDGEVSVMEVYRVKPGTEPVLFGNHIAYPETSNVNIRNTWPWMVLGNDFLNLLTGEKIGLIRPAGGERWNRDRHQVWISEDYDVLAMRSQYIEGRIIYTLEYYDFHGDRFSRRIVHKMDVAPPSITGDITRSHALRADGLGGYFYIMMTRPYVTDLWYWNSESGVEPIRLGILSGPSPWLEVGTTEKAGEWLLNTNLQGDGHRRGLFHLVLDGDLSAPFGAGLRMNADWRSSFWLGLYRPLAESEKWYYTPRLGWIHTDSVSDHSLWLFLPERGWFWTQAEVFPYMWNPVSENWEF